MPPEGPQLQPQPDNSLSLLRPTWRAAWRRLKKSPSTEGSRRAISKPACRGERQGTCCAAHRRVSGQRDTWLAAVGWRWHRLSHETFGTKWRLCESRQRTWWRCGRVFRRSIIRAKGYQIAWITEHLLVCFYVQYKKIGIIYVLLAGLHTCCSNQVKCGQKKERK